MTGTVHFNLTEPDIGNTTNWGLTTNSNWVTVDTALYDASGGLTVGVNAPAASAGNITLTNPLNNIQNISFSAGSLALILPAMNATASMIVGGKITVSNVGTNAFEVFAQDGTTPVVTSLAAGTTVTITLLTNSTANGTFKVDGPFAATGSAASFSSLSITGNTTIGGTLGVTGLITGSTGANITGNVAITGNETVNGTLGVTGVITASNAINEVQGANLASAATVNIGAATGNYINITGTTTITAFDTIQAGTARVLNFNGILTLTYDAIKLILPGAANIITAPGDIGTFASLGSGNWICISYQRAAQEPTLFGTQNDVTASRALNTVFQNTTGKTMFISITVGASSGVSDYTVLSDASNPPISPVAQTTFNTNTASLVLSFMVLNGNFYELTATGSGISFSPWIEWY